MNSCVMNTLPAQEKSSTKNSLVEIGWKEANHIELLLLLLYSDMAAEQ